MGVVVNQSFKNILIIFLAFAIGGVNVLYLYPQFLKDEYYGLVIYIFSASNLLMPLIAFGVQHSVIKFYSAYQDKIQRDRFLTMSLFLPLLIALPIGYFWDVIHRWIMANIPEENSIIEDYTIYIYLVAIACAYFEVFYSWSRVQLQSVFGNILKELWHRVVVMGLLFAVSFTFISAQEFLLYSTGFYFLRMIVMMGYAFFKYLPTFSPRLPENWREVLTYTGYIVLAGSAGAMIIDIDKVMIPGKKELAQAAYYSVAVFIGTLVEAPGRAMFQILNPLVSKALNEHNTKEVESLYKKSAINLLVVCGLFFLLINSNIHELYAILPEKFEDGVWVVLMISSLKLFSLATGSHQAIIGNSKYYKVSLPFALGTALSVYFLNDILIDKIGIDGAALSSLVVVAFFTIIKVAFIYNKLKIQPFTSKSLTVLILIVGLFFAFYFWHFPFHAIVNIILKSAIIVSCYLVLISRFNVSEDVNRIIRQCIKFLVK